MAKGTALVETKDFTRCNVEQLASFLMTHELHLGTHEPDVVWPKALALKIDEQEELETNDEEAAMIVRRFCNKNYKGKVSRKPTKLSSHKCGSPDYFIKECPWDTKKGKGKLKERKKDQPKPFWRRKEPWLLHGENMILRMNKNM